MSAPCAASFVLPTYGREDEPFAALAGLLASMARCPGRLFEVVAVDQNPEPLAWDAVAWPPNVGFKLLRAAPAQSPAKNAALAACEGEIVAICDDDATYPPALVPALLDAFEADPALDLAFGTLVDASGRRISPALPPRRGRVRRAFRVLQLGGSAFSFFRRRALAGAAFDAALGFRGADRAGASEDVDFALQAFARSRLTLCLPELAVVHPRKPLAAIARRDAFEVGASLGYVMRKHRFGWAAPAAYVAWGLGLAALALLRGRGRLAAFHLVSAAGKLAGYLAPARYVARRSRPPSSHPPAPSSP